nr:hypothetical protein [Nocardioides sp.]
MRVVDEDEPRLLGARDDEEVHHRRAEGHQGGSVAGPTSEHRVHGTALVVGERGDVPVEGAQEIGERGVGEVPLGLHALVARDHPALSPGTVRQLVQEGCLADAGVPLDRHGTWLPVQQPCEPVEVFRPADEVAG